jgi:hypothetical protein
MGLFHKKEHSLETSSSWFNPENAACLLFIVYAVFYSLWQFFGLTFDRIPGDLVDSRFNNYILEHGYRYLTGKDESFWNASFNYPEQNIIAYSDNFLGQLPFYAFFRMLGVGRESAYQCWMILAYLLNFFVCAWVIYKLSANKTASVFGAYIFTFSASILDQGNHAQMTARYPVPLAFLFLIFFFKKQKHIYFLFFLMSVLLMFCNSIYLGFLLSLALVPFTIGYLLFYRKEILFPAFFRWKQLLFNLAYLGAFGVLLYWYFTPYIEHNESGPFSPIKEDVFESLPRLKSYFMASGNSSSWHFLYSCPPGLKNCWNHVLFPGGLVCLSLLAIVLIAFGRLKKSITWMKAPEIKLSSVFGFSLLLVVLLTLRSRYLLLYEYVYPIPGFNAMRDLCRVLNIEFFLYAAIAAMLVSYLLKTLKNKRLKQWMPALLLILLFVDCRYDYSNAITFSKKEAQNECHLVVNKIKEHPHLNSYQAMVYMPENDKRFTAIIQLDAMFASQELGMKTVNSYTGTCPGPYCNFASKHSMEGLTEWFGSFGQRVDSTRYLIIR